LSWSRQEQAAAAGAGAGVQAELRAGNALLNIAFTGGAAVGPGLAGVAVAGLGVQTALLLDAVSFYAVAWIILTAGTPPENPRLSAQLCITMSLGLQGRFEELAAVWRKRGTELGLGIGIAAGYATLGRIGFEGRYDYGALGPVTNLASRLSSKADAGQILISQRVYAAVEDTIDAEPVGEIELKGFGRPVAAHEVHGLRSS